MTTLEDQTLEDEVIQEPEKSIEYYMANPDEMPEDIDLINAIAEKGGTVQAEGADTGDTDVVDDKVDDVALKDDESDRPNIETKNGKHTLPYGVLENTRTELNDTRTELSNSQSRIEELESVVDGYKGKAGELAAAEKEMHDGESAPVTADGKLDIEKLRSEYDDDVVDTMVSMHNATQAALQKVDDLTSKFESVISKGRQTEEDAQRESVQEAIDSIPFVAKIHAENGEDWKTAVLIDKSLRVNPLWKDKSYSDRFNEIARQMGDKSITTENSDLDSRVNNALRNAETKAPTSLSDLDGGEFIDVDGIQSGANLSVTQIEAQLENMSPEQMDEWLSRV